MAKYLLYLSTYAPIPVASVIDTKIKENIEKGGNAKNIAFWNWTPEQKNLLESILRRVIFTSYWSTGKTRIMFEKAKILAKEGKHVIFVLDSTKSYYPSFLYNSLLNEIKAADLSENLELMMSDGLGDVLKKIEHFHSLKKGINKTKHSSEGVSNVDVNIFIDEFTYTPYLKELVDSLIETISPTSYLWMAVGRCSTTSASISPFDSWLAEKLTNQGFHQANLRYAVRNSREIIEFDSSYSQSAQQTVPETELHELPNEVWPESGLMPINPTNQTHGPKPITIEHETSQSLSDVISECFTHFPSPKKILVIVIRPTPNIPSELINAVQNARGQYPIVIADRSSQNRIAIERWVCDETQLQDIIVEMDHIGGFEWPRVLVITRKSVFHQFEEKNCIMRAMSRLVILRTDSIHRNNNKRASDEQVNVSRFAKIVKNEPYQNDNSSFNGEQSIPNTTFLQTTMVNQTVNSMNTTASSSFDKFHEPKTPLKHNNKIILSQNDAPVSTELTEVHSNDVEVATHDQELNTNMETLEEKNSNYNLNSALKIGTFEQVQQKYWQQPGNSETIKESVTLSQTSLETSIGMQKLLEVISKGFETQSTDIKTIASSVNTLHILLQESMSRLIDQEKNNIERDHRLDEIEKNNLNLELEKQNHNIELEKTNRELFKTNQELKETNQKLKLEKSEHDKELLKMNSELFEAKNEFIRELKQMNEKLKCEKTNRELELLKNNKGLVKTNNELSQRNCELEKKNLDIQNQLFKIRNRINMGTKNSSITE